MHTLPVGGLPPRPADGGNGLKRAEGESAASDLPFVQPHRSPRWLSQRVCGQLLLSLHGGSSDRTGCGRLGEVRARERTPTRRELAFGLSDLARLSRGRSGDHALVFPILTGRWPYRVQTAARRCSASQPTRHRPRSHPSLHERIRVERQEPNQIARQRAIRMHDSRHRHSDRSATRRETGGWYGLLGKPILS